MKHAKKRVQRDEVRGKRVRSAQLLQINFGEKGEGLEDFEQRRDPICFMCVCCNYAGEAREDTGSGQLETG